jgi:Protein of unknown function (DUF2867)
VRLPRADHEKHGWVIGEIAPDFDLLDVWALPVEGALEDFDEVVDVLTSWEPGRSDSRASRLLFAVRYRLGAIFGWDKDTNTLPIPGCDETTLRDRLPDELRDSVAARPLLDPDHPEVGGFLPIYRTDREWAAELSNHTVHGVLQLGWVEHEPGRYRAQMGVYVKPRGWFGPAYLELISPFRHWIVYPALMRQIERRWANRVASS